MRIFKNYVIKTLFCYHNMTQNMNHELKISRIWMWSAMWNPDQNRAERSLFTLLDERLLLHMEKFSI